MLRYKLNFEQLQETSDDDEFYDGKVYLHILIILFSSI